MAIANIQEIVVRAASLHGYLLEHEQEQAILAFVSENVALPTSYGKSLCFGLLPCVFDLLRGVQNQLVVMAHIIQTSSYIP